MKTEEHLYGKLADGRPVTRYVVENRHGTVIEIVDYGAILVSLRTPDRSGKVEEITLGFDSLEGYLGRHPYFGATVGRFANRIAGGRFELEGKSYQLVRNNGPNHLHGGTVGFDKRMWEALPFARGSRAGVRFTYVSPDGEESYPGTVTVNVTYSLTEDDSLELRYEATTDRATPINITNHTYFNLKGDGKGTIEDHLLTLFADSFLPVDDNLIPTGELRPVGGTPFDFRTEKTIGRDLAAAGGYDHCFVVSTRDDGKAERPNGKPLRPVAQVYQPDTGRGLRLSATQPGVQLYTSNMLSPTRGRSGAAYGKHSAFCLETEAFPDAVNHPDFPSSVLKPGEKYDEITKLDFYRN